MSGHSVARGGQRYEFSGILKQRVIGLRSSGLPNAHR